LILSGLIYLTALRLVGELRTNQIIEIVTRFKGKS